MAVVLYSNAPFQFPPVERADADGLLLIGGRVTPERVLEAYPKGIFPWYNEGGIPLWWSPDPRFVLFPAELHVSRSMQKFLRKERFHFTVDTAFEKVIKRCASIERPGQDGTWLTPEMIAVYTELHQLGIAHSAEAWQGDRLVGGLYGLQLGKVFFGESMFSDETNASKFAFIHLVRRLASDGIVLFDCQVYTEHVESLGARMIQRADFISLLREFC